MTRPYEVNTRGGPDGLPVALVPRINIQAFCELPKTVESLQAAFTDRRMARAHATVVTGGLPAAIRLYQTQSTPNLLIVETGAAREELLSSLTALAEVCQPETKVVIIGHVNDVILYRELISRGVSEYVVAPVSPLQLIDTIASLYRSEKAVPIGRVIAFVGAKGGVGSSTISHNCGWELSRTRDVETAIVDLDLAFGTAALDFNLDASGGIMEALAQPERVDTQLLDRLLVRLGGKLSLLGGPGGVDKDFVIEAHAVEAVLTSMRASVPLIVVDVPALWAPWVRFTLLHADQVIITAEPELASLRNTRALADMLKLARPNDPPPTVILNQVGIPKRAEIAAADFRKAIGIDLAGAIPFDPQNFGAALNNGKMLLELAPRSKAAEAIRGLSRSLGGDKPAKAAPAGNSFLKKFMMRGKK
ncbi:CtpF protein [Aestuariivirga litoralis]|uniref:CtpF protein n=1 Tax=Aestuariivirga litoralis TaxID=2650924 RepID=A0A2W2BEL6_9HYPH|nr:CtpF protein [Aestuariivirga litoralis]PZF78714.1 CtpF protein [Aestuariivirga litoralis]